MLRCRIGSLWAVLYSAPLFVFFFFIQAVWCAAQKKAARSTMSVGFIVFLPSMEHCAGWFSQPRPLLDSVCVLSFVSLVPNIFIDIFVCWSHLRPPWVNINLRRQPRPLISWPFFGLSAFLLFTPHPLLQYCLWRRAHPLASYLTTNTRFETAHSSLFPSWWCTGSTRRPNSLERQFLV